MISEQKVRWKLPVASRHNVGLDRRICGIGAVSLRHDALVEAALGEGAVVAPDPEDDGALLLHGRVARGTAAVPVHRELTVLRVTAFDGPVAGDLLQRAGVATGRLGSLAHGTLGPADGPRLAGAGGLGKDVADTCRGLAALFLTIQVRA